MERIDIINKIGKEYIKTNIENGEWSYVVEAGSLKTLEEKVGRKIKHFKLDIRFVFNDISIIVETKQSQTEKDIAQLRDYFAEEKALHPNNKIICILANTKGDKIKVWKNEISDETLLKNEKVIDKMQHYISLFDIKSENDRVTVLQNTNNLNILLHKKDIDEKLRSQFVGTTLLYIKDKILNLQSNKNFKQLDDDIIDELKKGWENNKPSEIIGGIKGVLDELLNESENKDIKIKLLQKNVLEDQKVKALTTNDWVDILVFILKNIYKYINQNSAEGQDILNLFFIAFNKYTGKADKNQAFTPDHITEFMCRITEVNKDKRVFDGTCGSGSFLVQAMVKELTDCENSKLDDESKKKIRKKIAKEQIYGVEIEEKAYGLATTNMLIHGDGNSNIIKANIFDKDGIDFIKKADPDIILMNPPYNAKPKTIPEEYKRDWGKAKEGKEDPSKGFVFVLHISNIIKQLNDNRKEKKLVKMAVLLPLSCAIGTGNIMIEAKRQLLNDNTLEAVFTLPNEIFYPGASASVCCMVFTLGKSHFDNDGKPNKKTFFGYYKEDGFKKKKNLGRVEQFNNQNESLWKVNENKWVEYYNNKTIEDGISASEFVTENDEWLCEAYMKTDYSNLCESDFQKTINDYLAYLVKECGVK